MIKSLIGSWIRNLARGTIHPHPKGWGLLYPLTPRDKQACCDGKPVQFAALCATCHSRTGKNRSRWEAMIHRILDEIYNGKSYFTKEEWGNRID